MARGYGIMIREYRKSTGTTIESLARKLNVHRSTLTRFETEEYPPSPEMAIQLQEFLRLPESFLKLCDEARRERNSSFKRFWSFAHEHEYVGNVWIRVRPSVKMKEKLHKYTIVTYGDRGLHHAVCSGVINFEDNTDSICLIHRKFRHGDLHVTVEIVPDAEVIFGFGISPCDSTIQTDKWATKGKMALILEIIRERGYLPK